MHLAQHLFARRHKRDNDNLDGNDDLSIKMRHRESNGSSSLSSSIERSTQIGC